MVTRIEVREYISKKPNGDRDMSGGKDCSDYKIYLIRTPAQRNTDTEFAVQIFKGFDDFDVSHYEPTLVRTNAFNYAESLAKFFGVSIVHKVFREKKVVHSSWQYVP